MFTIVRAIILTIISIILIENGLDITTWQYWVIMILAGIGIPIVDALHDIYKNE